MQEYMPMKFTNYCIVALLFTLAVFSISCTSDTTNPSGDFTRIHAVDTVHFSYVKGTKVISLQPVKSTVPIRVTGSSSLTDSVIIVSFASAAVADTLSYQFRKHFYQLADTLHFYFDNVVDSIAAVVRDTQQIKLDSIWVTTPSLNPPKVLSIYP